MDRWIAAGIWGFGSPWLLLWGLAIVIPWMIHYWRKRPRQELQWGAMRFLEEALEQQSKRSRLEHWLLLVVRSLALLLVALAIARPWLQTGQEISLSIDRPPKLLIIVLDRSYSMNSLDEGKSLLEIAKKNALDQVGSLRKSDAIALLGVGATLDAIIPTGSLDHPLVRKEIESLAIHDEIGEVSLLVPTLSEVMERTIARYPQLDNIEVLLYSDFARNSWGKLSFRTALSELQSPRPVTWQTVSSTLAKSSFSNLGIRELKCLELPRIGQSVPVEVVVERFGGVAEESATLELLIDGITSASQNVRCNRGNSETVRFQWIPDRTGTFSVQAKLSKDDLENDNTRWQSIEVRRRRRTLILEQSYQSSRYLQVALQGESKPGASTELMTKKLVRGEPLNLDGIDAIIASDLGTLDENQGRALRQYVENGGAMMVWTGSNTRSNTWQEVFSDPLSLPFLFRDAEPNLVQGIDPRDYESEVVAPFRDFPKSGLLSTPIFRYWKIESARDSRMQIDLALANSQPLLMHHSLGQGMIYWMLTSPIPISNGEEEWNGFAGWPSFVPMVNEVHSALIGHSAKKRDYLVGESMFGTRISTMPLRGRLVSPGGSRDTHLWAADPSLGLVSWSLPPAVLQGIYRLEWEKVDEKERSSPGQVLESQVPDSQILETQYMAVNIDCSESVQEYLAEGELLNEVSDQGAVGSAERVSKSIRTAELFRWCLLALFACLIFESLVSFLLSLRMERRAL